MTTIRDPFDHPSASSPLTASPSLRPGVVPPEWCRSHLRTAAAADSPPA
ncbi:hypothetical protein [Microbispora corallina]|nr:hypothetical protein [Microbispora corallina]